MTEKVIAYMDMEFGGICGTWQRIKVPVEAGVVIHDEKTGSVRFAGREFTVPLDVTVWRNVTDELGRTVRKDPCTIGPDGEQTTPGMKRTRLDRAGWRCAAEISSAVHSDLKRFMAGLDGFGITTLVFFAADYELTALRQARVNLTGRVIRDLQEEIRSAYSQKNPLSLDRLSYITRFTAADGQFSSRHFRYPVPQDYRGRLKPHQAVGDAARIFLASREFSCYTDELEEGIRQYLVLCEECDKKNLSEGTGRSAP